MSEPSVYAQEVVIKTIQDRLELLQDSMNNCLSMFDKVVKAKKEIFNLYFSKQKCQGDIDELNKIYMFHDLDVNYDSDLQNKIDEQTNEIKEIEEEMHNQERNFNDCLKEYRRQFKDLQERSESYEEFLKNFFISTGGLE